MHNFVVRLIACFIFNPVARRSFRDRHIKPNKAQRQMRRIEDRLDYIQSVLLRNTDISKIPHAHGAQRTVQLLSLEILKTIDKVCKKHNIEYWLDFGTLLGAVRHGGFIPWDDDVDICMMAKDYEKFCAVAEQEFKNTCCYFKRVPSQIGKVLHIEFVPTSDKEWKKFIYWQLKGKLCFAVDIFPYYPSDKSIEEINEAIIKGKQAKSNASRHLKSYKDFEMVEQVTNNAQKHLISDNGRNIFLGLETIPYKPRVYPKTDFFPLKTLKFEGYDFPVPNKYDKLLNMVYGNYWEFPMHSHNHLDLGSLDLDEIDKLDKYKNF